MVIGLAWQTLPSEVMTQIIFFKSKRFVGESAEKLLKEIVERKADIGFIRALLA